MLTSAMFMCPAVPLPRGSSSHVLHVHVCCAQALSVHAVHSDVCMCIVTQAHRIDALPPSCGRLAFVGTVECFAESFGAIFPRHRVPLPPPRHVSAHSSPDACKNRLLRAFALADHPRLYARLCRLLLVDYECFGYALPKPCADAGVGSHLAAARRR